MRVRILRYQGVEIVNWSCFLEFPPSLGQLYAAGTELSRVADGELSLTLLEPRVTVCRSQCFLHDHSIRNGAAKGASHGPPPYPLLRFFRRLEQGMRMEES